MARDAGPDRVPAPSAAQLETAAAIFHMLSVPTRLHLMWLLCHDDYDVGSLAAEVGATMAAVSQHLAKLRMAGLVSVRREGRYHLYTADDPHVLLLVEQVFEHLAPDGPVTGRRQRGARTRRSLLPSRGKR